VGGAISVGDLTGLMEDIGFVNVEFVGTTGITTSQFTTGGHFRGKKPSEL
jgi:hypothetical protein